MEAVAPDPLLKVAVASTAMTTVTMMAKIAVVEQATSSLLQADAGQARARASQPRGNALPLALRGCSIAPTLPLHQAKAARLHQAMSMTMTSTRPRDRDTAIRVGPLVALVTAALDLDDTLLQWLLFLRALQQRVAPDGCGLLCLLALQSLLQLLQLLQLHLRLQLSLCDALQGRERALVPARQQRELAQPLQQLPPHHRLH